MPWDFLRIGLISLARHRIYPAYFTFGAKSVSSRMSPSQLPIFGEISLPSTIRNQQLSLI